jgi:hypothetical protein
MPQLAKYETPESLGLTPILTCRRDDPALNKDSTVDNCCIEGACESCGCCSAGWCIAGTDGPPKASTDPATFEAFYYWIDAHDDEVRKKLVGHKLMASLATTPSTVCACGEKFDTFAQWQAHVEQETRRREGIKDAAREEAGIQANPDDGPDFPRDYTQEYDGPVLRPNGDETEDGSAYVPK